MILISIGTQPSNRLVYDRNNPKFNYISGYHAEVILKDDGSIYLIDKGSTNGTKLNGRKIEPEVEVPVNRGDKVTFADVADLDWNKIPVIPTIDPREWDVYSFGSNLNNRIQLIDPSNTVSRFHATLKVNRKSGKLVLIDSSANGTFVKGQRISANQELPIKWKEQVTFANNIPLDWNKIKKPNPISLKPILTVAASIAAVLVIGLGIYSWSQGWFEGKMSDEQIFDKYANSVVLVVHQYNIVADLYVPNSEPIKNQIIVSDAVITGTAFFVDKKGLLLTNRHITMPWENLLPTIETDLKQDYLNRGFGKEIAFSDFFKNIRGETIRIGIALNHVDIKTNLDWTDFIDCAVINKSTDKEDKDVGFMRTKSRSLPNTEMNVIHIHDSSLKFTKDNIKKYYANGKKIFVLGYPYGINLLNEIKTGTTNTIPVKVTCQTGSINLAPDEYKFGVSAQMTQGASGSPVLDEKGRLIGVFNSGFQSTQGLNYAILIKHAQQLYEEIQ